MGRWRVYARCDDRFFTLADGVTFESEGWSPEWPEWIAARFVRDRNVPVYLQKSRVEGFKVENGEVIATLAGHEFAVQEPNGKQLREEFFGT